MELGEFVKKVRAEGYPQRLYDPDYDGACPCASGTLDIDGYQVYIHSRCWRVSGVGGSSQDLHIHTKHPKALKIADELKESLDKQRWYNPYKIYLNESLEKK